MRHSLYAWIAAVAVLTVTVAPCSLFAAQDAPPTKPASGQKPAGKKPEPSSLDKQLLEGLGGDLLDGLDLPPSKPKPATLPDKTGKPAEPSPEPAKPDGSGKPGESPGPRDDDRGEDIELSGHSANPIIDLGRRMKTVERLISENNTSTETQRMQDQIVADLSRLIDQIRQQKKQQKGGPPRRPRGRPAGQPGTPGDQESTDPAKDSQSRVGKADADQVEVRDLENLLKEVWGHLPEQVRQQMLSGSTEEVLPKYQKLIEEYYKRLAEDAANNP